MKAKNIYLRMLSSIFAISVIVASCKKEKENSKDIDTQAASDYEQTQLIGDDVSNMADAADGGITKFKTTSDIPEVPEVLSGCATVTCDTMNSTDPDTTTIDFGTSNCLCLDNRNRRGVITIIHSGNKITPGSYRTITFNNFFVNDNQIEGTHTITANGQNSNGNWNWTVTAQNMKITKSNGKFHSWNSTRNREMIAGAGTPYQRNDDVFLITGSSSGNNSNGKNYSALIIDALRKEATCKWIVKGSVQIFPDNKPLRTLDFGTGSCDDQATVTINGTTYNITLH